MVRNPVVSMYVLTGNSETCAAYAEKMRSRRIYIHTFSMYTVQYGAVRDGMWRIRVFSTYLTYLTLPYIHTSTWMP